jgi:CRP-like cAMP-binding protein
VNQERPNSLLSKLNKAQEASLFDYLTPYKAERHTVLQRAGEPADHVYFPTSGMISLLTVMSDGKAVETSAIGFDSAAGFNSALSGRNANCQAVVQIPLNSQRIAKRHFANAYENSAAVRQMVHSANELLIEQTQQVAACHALHITESRMARWLLQSHDYAQEDVLDLTQDFVSEMLGVRRTTVTLMAQMLQKEGLIKYRRGHVTIVSREGLERRCCECYRAVQEQRHGKIAIKPLAVPPS